LGRVRKFAIGSAVTVGVVLLLLAGSKRFNIGGRIQSAVGGLGSFLPGLGESFASNFAEGAGGFGETLNSIINQ